jgi:hypothetical protein
MEFSRSRPIFPMSQVQTSSAQWERQPPFSHVSPQLRAREAQPIQSVILVALRSNSIPMKGISTGFS